MLGDKNQKYWTVTLKNGTKIKTKSIYMRKNRTLENYVEFFNMKTVTKEVSNWFGLSKKQVAIEVDDYPSKLIKNDLIASIDYSIDKTLETVNP